VIRVSAVHEVTEEVVEAVRRLLPQLSSSARLPGPDEVGQVVRSPATTLLVARDDEIEGAGDAKHPGGRIVGMLTLAVFHIPTGIRSWIEDVVVDESARGRGVGEALTKAALGVAAISGAKTVDLTSRPSREAANRLYQKLGFEQRSTNVYRVKLRDDGPSKPS
jgi:ribosomal protein S18 acetylase RimI-like enzyme